MAVPVITGVVSLVVWLLTVGTPGALVSMTSSVLVTSLVWLPAASRTVAVTLYLPSGISLPAGICKIQVLPLTVRGEPVPVV